MKLQTTTLMISCSLFLTVVVVKMYEGRRSSSAVILYSITVKEQIYTRSTVVQ